MIRVTELEEQLKLNSKNSSKPPSSDPPSSPKPKPRRGKRKRGAQRGHKGSKRELLPPDQVKHFREHVPPHCDHCHAALTGTDPAPCRHQIWEIPPIKPFVTEHRFHSLKCDDCGKTTRAAWPKDVPRSMFGPHAQAITSMFSGFCFVTRRITRQVMDELFGLQMSLGTVSSLERRTNQALEEPVQEAHEYVKNSSYANADETGFRWQNKRGWLWVAVTRLVTVFMIATHRSGKEAKRLLGLDYSGFVGTDRWSAYNWLPAGNRQFCWAHLVREFERFQLRDGYARVLGQELQLEVKKMLRWWHRVRDGTLKQATFEKKMERVRRSVESLLREGVKCADTKTSKTCKELLKHRESLWVFVKADEVEPTNNAAERAMRKGVIWRKRSLGADSRRGGEFVERMLSVRETLRQQGRSVLEYLTKACEASNSGEKAPSLLPNQPQDPPS